MAEPLMKGRYTMYDLPDGGVHIAYDIDGVEGEPRHLEVPGMVVRMARAAAEGRLNPFTAMRQMMTGSPGPGGDGA